MSSYKKKDEPNKTNNKNDDLIKLLQIYLNSYNKYESNFTPELEVRFMTKSKIKLSNIKFENIIKILLNYGFKKTNEEYSLKIMNDDEANNIRIVINNINNIQKYCNTNNLDSIDNAYVEFINKNYYKINDKYIKPIDFDD